MTAKKVINKSVDELLAETKAALATSEEIRDDWERRYRSEYTARTKLAEEIGGLRTLATEATENARRADHERLDIFRSLAFAQGYIAALKGEPYPQTEVTGHSGIDPQWLRRQVR